MENRNLLLRTAVTAFALMGIYLLLTSSIIAGKTFQPDVSITSYGSKEPGKLFKKIPVATIQQALDKSKGKKIILNIYPVKKSKDLKKNDCALQIFFQDGDEDGKSLGETINTKKFRQQAGWYIAYLKTHKITQEKIPYGYFIEIQPSNLYNKKDLNIWIATKEFQMQYSYTLSTIGVAKDTTCKCPPDCCFPTRSLLSDSTGKCPPDCRIKPLLLSPEVEKIIKHTYKNN